MKWYGMTYEEKLEAGWTREEIVNALNSWIWVPHTTRRQKVWWWILRRFGR